MNSMALLGLLALLYAGVVIFITMKKTEKIWEMKKIKFFVKIMGEKGTVIFFYGWSLLFIILGLWLITK